MFVKNPNLPERRINAALIDYRAESAGKALQRLGLSVYITPELNIAYRAVSGHPDMMFHHADDDHFIVSPESFKYFSQILPDAELLLGQRKIGGTYPLDIAYNVARVNRTAFHRTQYTDPKIIEYYMKNGIKLIDIKQGYSKCSICVVSKTALITADRKIAQTAINEGMDVLLIQPGHIELKEQSYGFIGGCTGLISEEILAVNGKISNHPDYVRIRDFCRKHGVSLYPLHDGSLQDIGSIIPLYE